MSLPRSRTRGRRLAVQSVDFVQGPLWIGRLPPRAPVDRRPLRRPAGVGKTRLAQAISYEAINQGFVVRYRSIFYFVADLLSEEALAQGDRHLRSYLKPDLTIIDDIGGK